MFRSKIYDLFKVNDLQNGDMAAAEGRWLRAYMGRPDWLDSENAVRSINFSQTLAEETARLTTLAIKVNFDGGRGKYMASVWEKKIKPLIREWAENATAIGMIILKPNSVGSVEMVTQDEIYVTAMDSTKNITGVVFQHDEVINGVYYHLFEYQHKEVINGIEKYIIENRATASETAGTAGDEIDLKATPWYAVPQYTELQRQNNEAIDGMLFGVFKMPKANNIAPKNYAGMSLYSNAMEELRDLDVAYSRNSEEIYDSRRSALIDDRLLMQPPVMDEKGNIHPRRQKMPKWIRNVMGTAPEEYYQEINPALNTEIRKSGINSLLSQIGYKCGYSAGYFVLDEKTGMVTATQVEADDRRTIQLIKDTRDALETCLNNVFKAINIYADIDNIQPDAYEVSYSFGDITYNYEEDKQTCWKYVQAGKYPLWRYYERFEGMSEEEAKTVAAEAKQENQYTQASLFDDDEE